MPIKKSTASATAKSAAGAATVSKIPVPVSGAQKRMDFTAFGDRPLTRNATKKIQNAAASADKVAAELPSQASQADKPVARNQDKDSADLPTLAPRKRSTTPAAKKKSVEKLPVTLIELQGPGKEPPAETKAEAAASKSFPMAPKAKKNVQESDAVEKLKVSTRGSRRSEPENLAPLSAKRAKTSVETLQGSTTSPPKDLIMHFDFDPSDASDNTDDRSEPDDGSTGSNTIGYEHLQEHVERLREKYRWMTPTDFDPDAGKKVIQRSNSSSSSSTPSSSSASNTSEDDKSSDPSEDSSVLSENTSDLSEESSELSDESSDSTEGSSKGEAKVGEEDSNGPLEHPSSHTDLRTPPGMRGSFGVFVMMSAGQAVFYDFERSSVLYLRNTAGQTYIKGARYWNTIQYEMELKSSRRVQNLSREICVPKTPHSVLHPEDDVAVSAMVHVLGIVTNIEEPRQVRTRANRDVQMREIVITTVTDGDDVQSCPVTLWGLLSREVPHVNQAVLLINARTARYQNVARLSVGDNGAVMLLNGGPHKKDLDELDQVADMRAFIERLAQEALVGLPMPPGVAVWQPQAE